MSEDLVEQERIRQENLEDLIQFAKRFHGVELYVGSNDRVYIDGGALSAFVDFYQSHRSEIEEFI